MVGRSEGEGTTVREVLQCMVTQGFQLCPYDAALYQRMQPWDQAEKRWWVFLSKGTIIRTSSGISHRCYLACIDGWVDADGAPETPLQADFGSDHIMWSLDVELVVQLK